MYIQLLSTADTRLLAFSTFSLFHSQLRLLLLLRFITGQLPAAFFFIIYASGFFIHAIFFIFAA